MSKLTILGTTLGNLEDISMRGMKYVFESPIVLAEDTRVFGKLKGLLKQRYLTILDDLNLNVESEQKVISYREQNHDRIVKELLDYLENGVELTLVSDAGMPGISDPGWKLIDEVVKKGFEIDVIPGPTAVSSSLVLSGLPTDRFVFVGFLPRKRSKIKSMLEPYISLENTLVIYESPFRVKKSLDIINELFGEELKVALVSDISKIHQKVYRGAIPEVITQIKPLTLKGEWVICVRGAHPAIFTR